MSRIVVLLIAILKTTRSSITLVFRIDNNKIVDGGDDIETKSGKSNDRLDTSRKSIKPKSQTKNGYLGNTNHVGEPKFLISRAREAFNCLKQAFTKALIFRYFDLKYQIRIETDKSSYIIKKVLSQLILNQLTLDKIIKSSVNEYLVVYFSKKIIHDKT